MSSTINEITIRGTAERVIELAFDLPRWPSFLPHYRSVRVLEERGDHVTVEMACWRTGIPLRWRSHLWRRPAEGQMRFVHIAGPAKGMDVTWFVHQEGEHVHVIIRHDLDLQVPIVRSALGKWVVGEVFVGAVAGKTLECLKQAVEKAEWGGVGE